MTFYEFIKTFFNVTFTENREIFIGLAVIFLCAFAVLLLVRPFRLWYWKINKTRKEITAELDRLSNSVKNIEMIISGEEAADFVKEQEPEQENCEDNEIGEAEEPFENGETISTSFGEKRNRICLRGYDTDKQGRIYTEEEITKLIKD